MIWNWDEQTCSNLVMQMLKRLAYFKKIDEIRWLTRVASFGDETELRLVVKVCSADQIVVLRISSGVQEHVRERIRFQKMLYRIGIAVPAIGNVVTAELSEQLTVTAYLEEWIEGAEPSADDFERYAALLGKIHNSSRHIVCPFSVERDHLLYDTRRMEAEMRDRMDAGSGETESLIQMITVLMRQTQSAMKRLKRYPVHGDYSTDNLIKSKGALFLIDFGWSGLGYLPEEAGEAFAEISCSVFHFHQWKERLDEFLSVYESQAEVSELEMKLTQMVAGIALVIRVIHNESDAKKKLLLCSDILERIQSIKLC